MKKRVLFGIFPVWLTLQDEDGNELNQLEGFWSDIAHWVDTIYYHLLQIITFGNHQRDMFRFFPYEENGCKYWHQAMWCMITRRPCK